MARLLQVQGGMSTPLETLTQRTEELLVHLREREADPDISAETRQMVTALLAGLKRPPKEDRE